MGWSKVLPTATGMYTFKAVYNNITCSSVFYILNPAGVEEHGAGHTLNISPNPAHSTFTISLNNQLSILDSQLKIYDMMGRVVYVNEIRNLKFEIRNSFSSGIYFVRVEEGQKVWTEKLVIE
jgi:hypothetical protein